MAFISFLVIWFHKTVAPPRITVYIVSIVQRHWFQVILGSRYSLSLSHSFFAREWESKKKKRRKRKERHSLSQIKPEWGEGEKKGERVKEDRQGYGGHNPWCFGAEALRPGVRCLPRGGGRSQSHTSHSITQDGVTWKCQLAYTRRNQRPIV